MSTRPSADRGAVDLEAVIGLEVHCQLATASKIFCACPTSFGAAPNSVTCPVCLGLPGALPVLNDEAVELGVRLAVATGCRVNERSIFARKHYFYPDLPKGYQVTQFDRPLAAGGAVEIDVRGGGAKTIRIERIHLEEDAGKSVHDAAPTATLVDYNRAGTPLAEIVSEADFRAPDEAREYLVELRRLVRELGISDGNMEEGSLRCDCNVSVRPIGQEALGTRVELKNLNSLRSVVRSLEHEIERQGELVRDGRAVEGGTRAWDEQRQVTTRLRSKEEARDYRYFREPDLPPLVVAPERTALIRERLPEPPRARRDRHVAEHGLGLYEASVLSSARAVASYFDDLVAAGAEPRAAANWAQGEVMRRLKAAGAELDGDASIVPIAAARLSELIALVASGDVSHSAAKRAFDAMWETGRSADETVDAMGLRQVSDEVTLRVEVERVLAEEGEAVADYRAGHRRSFGHLMGRVMKQTGGKANPAVVDRLLREILEGEA